MRTIISWLALSATFISAPLWAQPAPPPPAIPDKDPPGAQNAPPSSMEAIAKAVDVPYRAKPAGHLVKFNLQDADLSELVNHISGLTGRRFIYGQKVRQIKATVVSPEPVTIAEAYETFLSILESNGMTVLPHGRFYKIVDSGGVVNQSTPVVARGEPVPHSDRYVTRLYRMQNIGADEAAALVAKFKSKEADVSVYAPGRLLIMTDTGTNIERMIRILEEIDVGGAGQSMWIEPIHYGSATEMAQRINELFGLNAPPGQGNNGGGLSKVVADQQSNSLIILGTDDSYAKLLQMLKRLDAAPDDSGRVRVVALQHAKAEDLANVLTQMLQAQKKEGAAAAAGQAKTDMFEGDIRVTADKATNSIIITSSARDYASVRLVVAQLDMPRRQVYIEAVIMDLDVSDDTKLGVSWHGGYQQDVGGGGTSTLLGGFKADRSMAFPKPVDPTMLQGLALGVRGPNLANSDTLLGQAGVSIPAFGVVLNALTTAGASNVLASPHLIATDNIASDIQIGKNVPLQTNVGSGLSSLLGASGTTGANSLASMPMGMMGMMGGSAQRQDVGIKIKVTPHINNSSQVRLELEQESSDRGAAEGALGAISIIKRTANTTVTVDDQQTIVIGGLTKEEQSRSDEKVPVLGDIPILGFLFRQQTQSKKRSNLMLILTPYIIRDQTDLRKIFERKMQERQEFLDRYFIFNGKDWSPPKDYSRANGLVEDIRQAYFKVEEQIRLLKESEPVKREHKGSEAIDLPEVPAGGGGVAAPAPGIPAVAPAPPVAAPPPGTPPPAAAPPPAATPPGTPPGTPPAAPKRPIRRTGGRPRSELDTPVVLRPMVRNVNTEY